MIKYIFILLTKALNYFNLNIINIQKIIVTMVNLENAPLGILELIGNFHNSINKQV